MQRRHELGDLCEVGVIASTRSNRQIADQEAFRCAPCEHDDGPSFDRNAFWQVVRFPLDPRLSSRRANPSDNASLEHSARKNDRSHGMRTFVNTYAVECGWCDVLDRRGGPNEVFEL
ncbi:hypothetical protein AC629_41590 [Bradyrhizobium sp. NAS80.1]|nr:hypothetical protein AC629_41590 [Bradyrhizobium sp. NAS80.1]